MNDDRTMRWQRARNELLHSVDASTSWNDRLTRVIDAIWAEFGNHRPVSWVGYYHLEEAEMTLGPRRDKPACSPIGLHGACGQSALSGKALIVADVRALGPNYIACDPKDLAELVIPVRDGSGAVIGVLDLDSYATGAFTEADQQALEGLVREFLGN